jgi:hypothetical protein
LEIFVLEGTVVDHVRSSHSAAGCKRMSPNYAAHSHRSGRQAQGGAWLFARGRHEAADLPTAGTDCIEVGVSYGEYIDWSLALGACSHLADVVQDPFDRG